MLQSRWKNTLLQCSVWTRTHLRGSRALATAFLGAAVTLSACSQSPEDSTAPEDTRIGAGQNLLEENDIIITAAFDEGQAMDDLIFLPNSESPWLGRIVGAARPGGIDLYNVDGERLAQVSGPRLANLAAVENFQLRGASFPLILGNDREGGLHAYVLLAETNQLVDAPLAPVTIEGGVSGLCLKEIGIGYVDYVLLSGDDRGHIVRIRDTGEDQISQEVRTSFALPFPARNCQVLNSAIYISGPTGGVTRLTESGEVAAQSEAFSIADLLAVELQGRPVVITSVTDTPLLTVYNAEDLSELSSLRTVDGLNAPMVSQAGAVAVTATSFGGTAYASGLVAIFDEGDKRIKLISREALSRAIIGTQLEG